MKTKTTCNRTKIKKKLAEYSSLFTKSNLFKLIRTTLFLILGREKGRRKVDLYHRRGI